MGSRFLLYILVINVTLHIICWVFVMANHFIVVHAIDLIAVGDDIEIYLFKPLIEVRLVGQLWV